MNKLNSETYLSKMTDITFISLVQEREPIYNAKLREHHNRLILEDLWKEVGEKMNMTPIQCKDKWTNLRNSYARHLRNQSSENRYRWFLADSMSFLRDHMQNRKVNKLAIEVYRPLKVCKTTKICSISNIESLNNETTTQNFKSNLTTCKRPSTLIENDQNTKKLLLDSEAPDEIPDEKETLIKYEVENSLIEFTKSLLPDFRELTKRRQRIFKLRIITLLNNLMDEQEAGIGEFPSSSPVESYLNDDMCSIKNEPTDDFHSQG